MPIPAAAANPHRLTSAETARANNNTTIGDRSLADAGGSRRWHWEEIDRTRWDKSFPYQLLVLEKVGNGYNEKRRFTLPFPPRNISESLPFATALEVTQGGINEQHNGIPLRPISLAGTTGLYPLRDTGTGSPISNNNGIFAGTIAAASSLAEAVRSGLALVDDTDANALAGTGYFQLHLLKRFLEAYAEEKKGRDGNKLRLAFAIWKDQSVYLVTPISFNIIRSTPRNHVYDYQLQLQAWARIKYEAAAVPPKDNLPVLTEVLQGLQTARQIILGSRYVLDAVVADAEAVVLEPIRQAIFFCKDALAASVAVIDLPQRLIVDVKASVLSGLDAVRGEAGSLAEAIATLPQNLQAEFGRLRQQKGKTGAGIGSGSNVSVLTNEDGAAANPANDVFNNPSRYPDFHLALQLNDLNLDPAFQAKLADARVGARTKTRADWAQTRDRFRLQVLALADAFGAGDASLNEALGLPPPTSSRVPGDAEFLVLGALEQALTQLDALATSSIPLDQNPTTTMDVVAGFARGAGIAFTVPTSKFAVPMPYGISLEQLSARYLGDPDRWIEIAALNGLRAPYVDEVGTQTPLLVHAQENVVAVSWTGAYYEGQAVTLIGVGLPTTSRHIIGIRRQGEDVALLTLDGAQDLDGYGPSVSAHLHSYAPDTVNSTQLIYIPSPDPVTDTEPQTMSVPGVDTFDPYLKVGGIDFLIDGDGDLVLGADGSPKLSVGLTNLVQKVRILLQTPQKSLLLHPEYGVGLSVGANTADLSVTEIKRQLEAAITSDPSFSGIQSLVVSKSGPTVSVTMAVTVTGLGVTVPVTVAI